MPVYKKLSFETKRDWTQNVLVISNGTKENKEYHHNILIERKVTESISATNNNLNQSKKTGKYLKEAVLKP